MSDTNENTPQTAAQVRAEIAIAEKHVEELGTQYAAGTVAFEDYAAAQRALHDQTLLAEALERTEAEAAADKARVEAAAYAVLARAKEAEEREQREAVHLRRIAELAPLIAEDIVGEADRLLLVRAEIVKARIHARGQLAFQRFDEIQKHRAKCVSAPYVPPPANAEITLAVLKADCDAVLVDGARTVDALIARRGMNRDRAELEAVAAAFVAAGVTELETKAPSAVDVERLGRARGDLLARERAHEVIRLERLNASITDDWHAIDERLAASAKGLEASRQSMLAIERELADRGVDTRTIAPVLPEPATPATFADRLRERVASYFADTAHS